MDSAALFKDQYLGNWEPSESDAIKHQLAKRYHELTENYDRTVCTGPIMNGSIRPANHYQLAAINRNATKVRGMIMTEADREGISREEMRRTISRFDQHDMRPGQ